MTYRVLVSYGGKVNATAGQTVEYTNKAIVNDLLNAGYIEEIKGAEKNTAPKSSTEKPSTATTKAPTKKRATKKEG
ncbi:hypothetical protein [Anaerovibrio sp. JC8]|uniref:hypothetical protein n=1 Tax=Anaerovibrio sp. JC8 TaxID=1240085 RepID=UPI000A122CFB|nr:hypothetical protein [Anaerovibrio sp. JC8]